MYNDTFQTAKACISQKAVHFQKYRFSEYEKAVYHNIRAQPPGGVKLPNFNNFVLQWRFDIPAVAVQN